MLLYNFSKFLDNPYREDIIVKITLFSSLIINIAIWVAIYFKLHPFSYLTEYQQIYLHYNIYFGIDSIGFWYMAFVIPLLGLIIIIFNNILAYTFYLKEKIISYIFIISQTIIQIILLAAAVFIILLNI
jgi:hypothetical protein